MLFCIKFSYQHEATTAEEHSSFRLLAKLLRPSLTKESFAREVARPSNNSAKGPLMEEGLKTMPFLGPRFVLAEAAAVTNEGASDRFRP